MLTLALALAWGQKIPALALPIQILALALALRVWTLALTLALRVAGLALGYKALAFYKAFMKKFYFCE